MSHLLLEAVLSSRPVVHLSYAIISRMFLLFFVCALSYFHISFGLHIVSLSISCSFLLRPFMAFRPRLYLCYFLSSYFRFSSAIVRRDKKCLPVCVCVCVWGGGAGGYGPVHTGGSAPSSVCCTVVSTRRAGQARWPLAVPRRPQTAPRWSTVACVRRSGLLHSVCLNSETGGRANHIQTHSVELRPFEEMRVAFCAEILLCAFSRPYAVCRLTSKPDILPRLTGGLCCPSAGKICWKCTLLPRYLHSAFSG